MGNFDDLSYAVASFGKNNRVVLDDTGKPSIMVGIPKMKFSDIIAGGTQEVLPWWIIDGEEKDVIWVSKYINCVVNDRAYSLPMKDPQCYVTFDQALQYCRKKGAGWHLNQNGVFAALVLWAEKNGTIPRGNTNWDASYEKAWERGVNTYIDGSHAGGRTATGSGPVTWNHDHSAAGIADLCGNCWEWVAGMRLVDGEIQIIPYGHAMKPDCSMGSDSTEWKAIMPNGTLVEPGTAGTLKIDGEAENTGTLQISTSVSESGEASGEFRETEAATGVEIPRILIAAGLFPETGMISPGNYCAKNDGERIIMRGSGYDSALNGGIAAADLRNERSYTGKNVSFRSAYVELAK